MISPDSEILDVSDYASKFLYKLVDSSVLVETGHGCERTFWHVRSIRISNHAIGICRITYNQNSCSPTSIIIKRLALINENLSIILQ